MTSRRFEPNGSHYNDCDKSRSQYQGQLQNERWSQSGYRHRAHPADRPTEKIKSGYWVFFKIDPLTSSAQVRTAKVFYANESDTRNKALYK